MAEGSLPPTELYDFLRQITDAREHARRGYILYLKHSGERIGDLRSLGTDELYEWYRSVRDINERREKQVRERMEMLRRSHQKRT